VTGLRNAWVLVSFLILFGLILVPLVADHKSSSNENLGHAVALIAILANMTIFLTPVVRFDFRGDIDRIEVLKSLPIRPSWLVVGQLAAPVVLVSVIQMIVLVGGQLAMGRAHFLISLAALFLPPFNFVLFAVDNLIFLLFPTRMMPTTPGDLQ